MTEQGQLAVDEVDGFEGRLLVADPDERDPPSTAGSRDDCRPCAGGTEGSRAVLTPVPPVQACTASATSWVPATTTASAPTSRQLRRFSLWSTPMTRTLRARADRSAASPTGTSPRWRGCLGPPAVARPGWRTRFRRRT